MGPNFEELRLSFTVLLANIKILAEKDFHSTKPTTLYFQLDHMFQLIVTPQGNVKATIQLKDAPTKVYTIDVFIKGALRSASKLNVYLINSHAS